MSLPTKEAAAALLREHVRDDYVSGSAQRAPVPATLLPPWRDPGHASRRDHLRAAALRQRHHL